jgi:hypothetical protein
MAVWRKGMFSIIVSLHNPPATNVAPCSQPAILLRRRRRRRRSRRRRRAQGFLRACVRFSGRRVRTRNRNEEERKNKTFAV